MSANAFGRKYPVEVSAERRLDREPSGRSAQRRGPGGGGKDLQPSPEGARLFWTAATRASSAAASPRPRPAFASHPPRDLRPRDNVVLVQPHLDLLALTRGVQFYMSPDSHNQPRCCSNTQPERNPSLSRPPPPRGPETRSVTVGVTRVYFRTVRNRREARRQCHKALHTDPNQL
jgi:hypothetical protein